MDTDIKNKVEKRILEVLKKPELTNMRKTKTKDSDCFSFNIDSMILNFHIIKKNSNNYYISEAFDGDIKIGEFDSHFNGKILRNIKKFYYI